MNSKILCKYYTCAKNARFFMVRTYLTLVFLTGLSRLKISHFNGSRILGTHAVALRSQIIEILPPRFSHSNLRTMTLMGVVVDAISNKSLV